MPEPTSLMNVGDLAKPATTLIEKISDAIGGIAKPWQIKRVAGAEADAKVTAAKADLAIQDLQLSALGQRAMKRIVHEEARKQANIEGITAKALPDVQEDAKPDKIDDDWLVHFFERARLFSDQDMQSLWARVLAGEANAPGRFSRRTIETVATLDKRDAEMFTRLCGFAIQIGGGLVPLVFEPNEPPYTENGLSFLNLTHLGSIGLVAFNPIGGHLRNRLSSKLRVYYYGTPISLELPEGSDTLDIGRVLFTRAGEELAPSSGSRPVDGFLNYLIARWQGLTPKVGTAS